VADAGVSGDLLFDVMMRVGRLRGVEFRIAPSLFNCLPRKTEIDQIGALPMIQLFREPLSSTARIVKRTMDILVALFALALLSPLWIVIAHRQTQYGHSRRFVGARPALAALARHRRAHQVGFKGQRLLQAGARRDGRAHLPLPQISHDADGL
jgi:hypothetical protein